MHNWKTIDRYVLNLDRCCYADLAVYDGGHPREGEPKARLYFAAGLSVTLSGAHAAAARAYFGRHAAPLGPCPTPRRCDTTSTAEVAATPPAGPPLFTEPFLDPDDFGPVS